MNSQLSLSGFEEVPDLPPGFVYQPDFLTVQEHDSLVELFESWDFNEIRMRGVAARRTSRQFGVSYNLETYQRVERPEWPDELRWVKERAASLGGLSFEDLRQGMILRYPVGAPIGWHKDRPMYGPKVVGISLRSACRMRFRRGEVGAWETKEIELEPRSAYVIGGEARTEWEHHIPPARDLRYSITFRSLKNVQA